MDNYMVKEVRDKVSGSVKEVAGKVTDNKALEFKGKLQKGKGKAREVVRNVGGEMDIVKDKVVGSVKEATGKLTNDELLQIRGRYQKNKLRNQRTNKVLLGLGILASLVVVKMIIDHNEK